VTGSEQAIPERLVRGWFLYPAVSLLILVPCFWQPRIQAGDLSSHIYNAWLVQLIEQGHTKGLKLVPQTQNVFFDILLSNLLPVFGPGPAQRIAVSAAVLIFFWGAFAFLWVASRRAPRHPPWHWIPCLVMLAYGWVYHMGLFNFYISLGLSLGALAVAWRGTRWAVGIAGFLILLAYVAHALPCVWALGAMAYNRFARALAPRRRIVLLVGALMLLAVVSLLFRVLYAARWEPGQFWAFTGADQLWVFDAGYLPLAGALLVMWAVSFREILVARGLWRSLRDIRLQLCCLTAAFVLLVPGIVRLRTSGQEESLLIGRMSLAVAVLYCGLAASRPARTSITAGMAALACIFFSLVYANEAALNRVEDKMDRIVAQLPPGRRVISALVDPNRRLFSLLHVIDRACIGHCFSYANYEPSVGQFRLRAERGNGIVVANFRESWAMQAGGYVVKPADLPLYRVDLCNASTRDLCITPVQAGETLKSTWLHVTPRLWKEKGSLGS
jgi:hypothetical protein